MGQLDGLRHIMGIKDLNILAVITARANSQGLPGKNYKNLLGRPLIQWSLLAALRSIHLKHVVVSSNCNHVKEATEAFCQEFDTNDILYVERPDELATSTSINEEALLHAVQFYEEYKNIQLDVVLNLQPTSPVRINGLVDDCIERFYDSDADSLLTVDKHTPFFWQITSYGPEPKYDILNRPMRQDIRDEDWMYHDNGNIYITKMDVLVSKMCRTGDSPFLFETDSYQSLQIDTEEDFQLIEKMAEVRGGLL